MPISPETPAYLHGKTANEVLELTKQLAQVVSAQKPPAPAPSPATMPSDELWYSKPAEAAAEMNKALQANIEARYSPLVERLTQGLASTARGQAQFQFKAEFEKWGAEIDQLVNGSVPAEQRTLDTYAKAIGFVKANHLEELVAERVKEQLTGVSAPGERSGGSSATPHFGTSSVRLEDLPSDIKSAMLKEGISAEQVTEFCYKTGLTPEKWVEMAKADQVFVSRAGEIPSIREEKLGITRVWEK